MVDFASTRLDLECAPSVMALLAMEILAGSESNPMKVVEGNPVEGGGLEKVDRSQLSLWVINRIKAFRKSVGTLLKGFEEQVIGLFLALEGSQRKMVKVGQKGH